MKRTLTPGAIFLFAVVLHAQTVPIYNSIPGPNLPMSLPSRSFEAGLISEYGNEVMFSGTSPFNLTSVTVVMVTGAYPSKYPTAFAMNPASWSHPITINLYSVDSTSGHPEPGVLIRSVQQTFMVPWRHEPDPTCANPTFWRAPDDGQCHYGLTFPISFNFSGMTLTSNQLIFGIAYNTQSAGQPPLGVVGPYNDLNVGVNVGTPTVGTNLSFPMVYLNSSISGGYVDMGPAGKFRLDVGSDDGSIAIEFNVPGPPSASITVSGGGTQSATLNTQFPSQLATTVKDASGKPISGVTVTFTVPTSGASARLSSNTAVTDVNGNATVTATANGTTGTYNVTATAAGATGTATFVLTNTTSTSPAPVPATSTPVLILTGMALIGMAAWLWRRAAYLG
jgi:adhesin/invasin